MPTRMQGENLHSVSVSEIQVDIGGETCVITAVDTYKGQVCASKELMYIATS